MKQKHNILPSNERLNELFIYNPTTGELRRKVGRKGGGPAGSIAGSSSKQGYLRIMIDGGYYRVHRVCYKMATGRDPGIFEIDHINGIRNDNRLSNLRMVDRATNSRNVKRLVNNSSGYNGISFNKRKKVYETYIRVNQKKIHLGYFKEEEDAVAARAAANVKHGFHVNHGRVA